MYVCVCVSSYDRIFCFAVIVFVYCATFLFGKSWAQLFMALNLCPISHVDKSKLSIIVSV